MCVYWVGRIKPYLLKNICSSWFQNINIFQARQERIHKEQELVNWVDGWINGRDQEVDEKEEGTSLCKGGMWNFLQEQRILCVNYSQVIKIHAAHLPETAGKKDVEYLIVCINTVLNGVLWGWGLFLDYKLSGSSLIIELLLENLVCCY